MLQFALPQTISEFKRKLLNTIRPFKRSTFNIHELEGIKHLTRLRVEFSALCYHRFRHHFCCDNTSCLCRTCIEDNEHYLLHCLQFTFHLRHLLNWSPGRLVLILSVYPSNELVNLILYGHQNLTVIANRIIIEVTLKYIREHWTFQEELTFGSFLFRPHDDDL